MYSGSIVGLLLATFVSLISATPLDDYVWKPDSHYGYEYLEGQEIHGRTADGTKSYTGYMLNVTSQQWLTPEDVTQSIWWHILVVIVPSEVNYQANATLWVTGGNNNYPMGLPTNMDEDIWASASLAMNSGTITGALFQIPNQHVTFSGDPEQKSRSEDSIIAYTWDHFLKDPDSPEWLVRLPMVKSCLRAMDAMTDFVATKLPETNAQLDYYVVAGASKRGWTTWLVGAVDPDRVMAIVPIVLDAVNFIKVMHHQYQSYNGWSFALDDYYSMNITGRFDDPNMHKLSQIEDPYFYFDRLTMPKLVVNAVGDEFQQPDDTHYWWKDLPEPKHFLLVPNAEHSLATGILEAIPAIGTWIEMLLEKHAIPQMAWERDANNGDITLTIDGVGEPLFVRKWWATSSNKNLRRDFRFINIDDPCDEGYGYDGNCINTEVFWKSEIIHPTRIGGRTYKAHMDTPTDGTYGAFMIDVKFKNEFKLGSNWHPGFIPKDKYGVLEFTTEVSIVPDTFPYPDCHYEGCTGVLV